MTKPNSPPQPAHEQRPEPPKVWRYPFLARGGKEITDPQILYWALGRMEDGFFPLGVNGFPHGGVHFGAASARDLDQNAGVRVIANGEIVAFKLDDAYSHIQFTQDHRWGMYSTGFVLVRHKMTMPPAPGSTAAQPADETLTFYSLYMHMADWATYLANGDLVRPGWWPGVDAFRIGNKQRQIGSTDAEGVAGAFVYQEPKADKKGCFTPGASVGFLPEDSEVIVSEKRGSWAHIKSISSGAMIAASSGGYFGQGDGSNVPWLRPDGDEHGSAPLTPEGDWGWINYHDQRAMKEPHDVGKVVVPPHPIQITAGTLLGQLGEYHDYERSTPLPPVPARQLLHLEVFAGDELKPFIEKSRARAAELPPGEQTILLVHAGAKLVPKPIDPDMTLGQSRPLLKLVPTENSPKTGRWVLVQPWRHDQFTTLNVLDGSPVWVARDDQGKFTSPNGMRAWSRFPLQSSAAGDPANGTALAISHAQLDSLDKDNVAADESGVRWWRIEFGTADGKQSSGWVRGKNQSGTSYPGTTWESPWAWPGFEFVDATGISLADAFRRNLVVCGNADWKEQSEFEPSLAAVNDNSLLQRLEQTVARLPLGYNEKREKGKNGEEVVTAKKLQRAMYTYSLASELAHVILRYESEWGGGMARWDAITPLMRNARENWQCELTRIRKLQWWDDVKGRVTGFPSSPVVNHIHPVAMIANFVGVCPDECTTKTYEFHTTEGLLRVSKKAFDFLLSKEGYKAHPYVPDGDQSSGVTVGYGYDLGQQTKATISADLDGIFQSDHVARLQEASGVHGNAARHLAPSFADIFVTQDMALRLVMVMKRRFAQQTVDAFPGVTKIHPHCQGTLLSLVINRGPGMEDKPHQKSRAQMRAIRADIAGNNLHDVPVQLRKMKELWQGSGQGGLLSRRDDEAALFEGGMNCNCWR
ncbi:pesticin C-terminus-like muramidase [Paraburkholderia youngii]|uniref:pesticin C-terminus-like muramidase n=2 Tax=Paraburkholderia TaxID=1822464 RepID=UPI0020CF6D7B|nr:pesticin C-terminus-like muramidase [Paraburkholderia youngii]